VGDRRGEGITLRNVGHLEERLGHREEAERAYRQALAIFEAISAEDYARSVQDSLARLDADKTSRRRWWPFSR
jgi:Flp pilus assembly protein TadD